MITAIFATITIAFFAAIAASVAVSVVSLRAV